MLGVDEKIRAVIVMELQQEIIVQKKMQKQRYAIHNILELVYACKHLFYYS